VEKSKYGYSYHDSSQASQAATPYHWDTKFDYTFQNFFHPYVGKLISTL
jgi:hypothetical protein